MGVCDFSKPGVDQQPTISWLTYQDAAGHVIYGGRPLGDAPVSVPFGPSMLTCVDRRRFSFRLHHPSRERVVRAVAYVNGRVTKRVRGHNLQRLSLRRLPRGDFVVKIRTTTTTGAVATSERRYRGCSKTRPHNHTTRRHGR
jgi:hypothetical protein